MNLFSFTHVIILAFLSSGVRRRASLLSTGLSKDDNVFRATRWGRSPWYHTRTTSHERPEMDNFVTSYTKRQHSMSNHTERIGMHVLIRHSRTTLRTKGTTHFQELEMKRTTSSHLTSATPEEREPHSLRLTEGSELEARLVHNIMTSFDGRDVRQRSSTWIQQNSTGHTIFHPGLGRFLPTSSSRATPNFGKSSILIVHLSGAVDQSDTFRPFLQHFDC